MYAWAIKYFYLFYSILLNKNILSLNIAFHSCLRHMIHVQLRLVVSFTQNLNATFYADSWFYLYISIDFIYDATDFYLCMFELLVWGQSTVI